MAISLQRHIVSDITCSSLETKREILVVQVVGRVVLENNYWLQVHEYEDYSTIAYNPKFINI